VGMRFAEVNTSWSFATDALAAAAVQTWGTERLPGQANSSGLRVSIQNG